MGHKSLINNNILNILMIDVMQKNKYIKTITNCFKCCKDEGNSDYFDILNIPIKPIIYFNLSCQS